MLTPSATILELSDKSAIANGSHSANLYASKKFAIGITTSAGPFAHSSQMGKPAKGLKRPVWYAREWLAYRGVKQSDIVAQTGHTKSEVSEWVGGTRRFNADVLAEFAKVIGCEPGDLLKMPGKNEALLVGKVGAGAEIIRFDEGTVLAGIEPPPGLEACNAAEITGDSQYPLQEGWLIFYGAEHQGIPEECVGKLCIVGVKDGPTLLKTLKRGTRKGLWRLESWNAPPREDVKIEWAARVLDIRPV